MSEHERCRSDQRGSDPSSANDGRYRFTCRRIEFHFGADKPEDFFHLEALPGEIFYCEETETALQVWSTGSRRLLPEETESGAESENLKREKPRSNADFGDGANLERRSESGG